jgi:hypothetical protein
VLSKEDESGVPFRDVAAVFRKIVGASR